MPITTVKISNLDQLEHNCDATFRVDLFEFIEKYNIDMVINISEDGYSFILNGLTDYSGDTITSGSPKKDIESTLIKLNNKIHYEGSLYVKYSKYKFWFFGLFRTPHIFRKQICKVEFIDNKKAIDKLFAIIHEPKPPEGRLIHET